MKRECILLLFAAALVALPGAARAYRLEESWHRSITVKEGTGFALDNASGSITIEGWAESTVDVTADILVKSPSKFKSRKLYEGIRFAESSDGPGVHIEARLPKVRQDVLVGGTTGQHTSITIRYTIKVPRHTPLSIHTIDGDVSVAGVAGAFVLRTDNGEIVARSLDGAGTIGTGNGSIDVSFSQLPANGRLSIRAANGSLVLSIRGTAGARIVADAVNGGVHVDLPAGHLVDMKRGHWTGTLNGGGAIIELHTVSGEIYVRQSAL
jgi:hypothetical protein